MQRVFHRDRLTPAPSALFANRAIKRRPPGRGQGPPSSVLAPPIERGWALAEPTTSDAARKRSDDSYHETDPGLLIERRMIRPIKKTAKGGEESAWKTENCLAFEVWPSTISRWCAGIKHARTQWELSGHW